MSKGRVLVIDDSQALLSRVKLSLTAAGYEVTTTSQTVGAARHLRTADLVIIDFHMPGLDGANVLESLKAAAASSESKPAFYLFTSDADTSRRWRELGFEGAFSDKGNDIALVEQVDALFRLRRLRGLAKR